MWDSLFAGGFPVAPCTPSDGVGVYRTKWRKASTSLQGTRFSLFQRAFRLRVEDSALWTPSPPLRMEMTSTEQSGCARRWVNRKTFHLCVSGGKTTHDLFQLLFGESARGSFWHKSCPLANLHPSCIFSVFSLTGGGRACYTGCNFIRTVLSHERL